MVPVYKLPFVTLFTVGRSAIALTSTLDGRQTTCPGEVVTYNCTVLRTSAISWFALPDINGVDYFPRDQIGQRIVGDFQLALTSNVPISMGLADLTITLTVTATLARNGTVVECRGDEPSERMSLVLNVASKHIACSQHTCTSQLNKEAVVNIPYTRVNKRNWLRSIYYLLSAYFFPGFAPG